MAIEFFINRVAGGYELVADGEALDLVFASPEDAADMAVRFAQDLDASGYRIFYP